MRSRINRDEADVLDDFFANGGNAIRWRASLQKGQTLRQVLHCHDQGLPQVGRSGIGGRIVRFTGHPLVRNSFVLLAMTLGSCSKARPEAVAPSPEQTQFGRWTITPASNGAVTIDGHPYLLAWRLDTKTGDIELCTFDPNPQPISGAVPPALSCSEPAEASGREQ